jgi:hypothetical protein
MHDILTGILVFLLVIAVVVVWCYVSARIDQDEDDFW